MLLGKKHHPHALQLKDTFHEDDFCFLVTDLVVGGELFDRFFTDRSHRIGYLRSPIAKSM